MFAKDLNVKGTNAHTLKLEKPVFLGTVGSSSHTGWLRRLEYFGSRNDGHT